MDQTTIFVFVIGLIMAICYTIYINMRGKVQVLEQNIKSKTDLQHTLAKELHQERGLVHAANERASKLETQLATITADYRNLHKHFSELTDNQLETQNKFELLANRVLEVKSEKFDRQHKEGIKQLLEPLKERIKNFEHRVEQSSKETLEQHTALRSQIFHLRELNEKITAEATNLTKALKGDNKVQGSWGELILESILDKSGLEKDREYFVQPSFTDSEGRRQRPDVVVTLPDNKKIIIDSKVSLKAYEAMHSEEDPKIREIASISHQRSIKQHIDGLAAKNYHELYQIESPDFVLMFIPIDTAFAAAISRDGDLYGYAFDKNIVIVTPSTLLATLKTVETIWRNENQHKYALEIASEAGKMYDKLAILSEDLLDIGKRLDQTKDVYQESMKKLVNGRGNLMGRAQKVKSLGAKANKSINEKIIKRIEEPE